MTASNVAKGETKLLNKLIKNLSGVNKKKVVVKRRQTANVKNPLGVPQTQGFRGNNKRQQFYEEDEFVANIIPTSSEFSTIGRLAINPGQLNSFPWLAEIARNFQMYRFHYLEFYYKPIAGIFDDQGKRGKVLLACTYDASLGAPYNKRVFEDIQPHSDGLPYQNQKLILSIKEMHKEADFKYVRVGPFGGGDIKTYDVGNLWIGSDGITVLNEAVGELRVRYRVEFSSPVIYSLYTPDPNNSLSEFNVVGVAAPSSGTTALIPFNNAGLTVNGAQIEINDTTNVINLFPGNYLCFLTLQATSGTNQVKGIRGWLDQIGQIVPIINSGNGVDTDLVTATGMWYVQVLNTTRTMHGVFRVDFDNVPTCNIQLVIVRV